MLQDVPDDRAQRDASSSRYHHFASQRWHVVNARSLPLTFIAIVIRSPRWQAGQVPSSLPSIRESSASTRSRFTARRAQISGPAGRSGPSVDRRTTRAGRGMRGGDGGGRPSHGGVDGLIDDPGPHVHELVELLGVRGTSVRSRRRRRSRSNPCCTCRGLGGYSARVPSGFLGPGGITAGRSAPHVSSAGLYQVGFSRLSMISHVPTGQTYPSAAVATGYDLTTLSASYR